MPLQVLLRGRPSGGGILGDQVGAAYMAHGHLRFTRSAGPGANFGPGSSDDGQNWVSPRKRLGMLVPVPFPPDRIR